MAVIGSIRKRSKLLFVIIVVALLAFVLGDALGGGFGNTAPIAGTIAGKDVDTQELEREASKLEQLYTSYGNSITRDQARKQAWSNMVRDKVYFNSVKESGFSISEDEFDDMRWGASVMDEFSSGERFKSANGVFSPDSVQRFYAAIYANRRDIYTTERERLIDARLTDKFNALISKGVYYNDVDAKDAARGTVEKATFKFTTKKYSEIADSTIAVDDAMLRTYYNDHKNDKDYKQDEARKIEYINFTIDATEADAELIKDEANLLKSDFRGASNDSSFVSINSDVSAYAVIEYSRGTRSDEFDSQIADAEIGTVVGPYRDGETFKLAKIISKTPKEESKVRHILLNSPSDDPVIKLRADSILRVFKRRGNFDELAEKFSEDPGYASNQGIYDWFTKGKMVPEFEDYSFNNSKGSKGVVKTQFGYHIMEVLGRRTEDQSQIVELTKNIVPSTETSKRIYDEASIFSIDYGTGDKFNTGAEEKGYVVESIDNLKMSARNIGPVNDAREVIRWAYDDERASGEISKVFDLDNNYIVAKYISKIEEGVPAFDDVKDKVEKEVIKQIKGDQIISMINGAADLAAAAAALDKDVNDANSVSYNATGVPGAGNEPLVVGTAFSLEEGEVSEPIRAVNGIFVVELISKSGTLEEGQDYSSNKKSLMQRSENAIKGKIQSAMNEAAGVEDNMDKLY